MQFSVAVLARLSKAGIDAFTLRFGQAICCNFALEPRAQELVSEAIHKAKKYGSYGDLMWFGFGIKDIVTDLADTEEGLTLVALCAALSTTYDSTFAAQVIREICVLCKAPQSFTTMLLRIQDYHWTQSLGFTLFEDISATRDSDTKTSVD